MVYLEEAHPVDGWLYESVTHLIRQHTTEHERRNAASILGGELQKLDAPQDGTLPLVVDTMTNAASLAFGDLLWSMVLSIFLTLSKQGKSIMLTSSHRWVLEPLSQRHSSACLTALTPGGRIFS